MRHYTTPLRVQSNQTNTLRVQVSRDDKSQSDYLYVPLDIPDGLTRIDITYEFAKSWDFEIDIGLFEPAITAFPSNRGFRGWSGGARSSFYVAIDSATPGYVPGPLTAGKWCIILGLVQLPEGNAEVILRATGDSSVRESEPRWQEPTWPTRAGPLWAKGDCHCHTFHSDARGSPQTLHAQAARAGLDFLFITDHNTTTGWADYFAEASSPELIFLPGMEITVNKGHGNALGISQWVDFRLETQDDPDRLLENVHEAGGLFSINHDKPDIAWYQKVPAIDCMEVWQRPWLIHNDVSRDRYDLRLLTLRRRITAIGGSDWHQPVVVSDSSYVVGNPTTVLWCEQLNREGVLAALRHGMAYITEGPQGPALEVTVNDKPMGSLLTSSQGCRLKARTSNACGDILVLIADGVELNRFNIDETGEVMTTLPRGLTYVRAEIVAAANREALMHEFRQWLFDHGPPRGFDHLQDRGHPIVRALANPHYFGDWQ